MGVLNLLNLERDLAWADLVEFVTWLLAILSIEFVVRNHIRKILRPRVANARSSDENEWNICYNTPEIWHAQYGAIVSECLTGWILRD